MRRGSQMDTEKTSKRLHAAALSVKAPSCNKSAELPKLERVRIPSNPRAHHHYNQHPSYQPHQASNQPGLPDPMPSGCHQIIEFWKPPASQDRVIEFWKPLASQDRVKVVRGVRLPSHTLPQGATGCQTLCL